MGQTREVQQLLAILDQSYDRRSWHGPNLRGSIRGVAPAQAAWRPAPVRHNIWEIVVHAAYWKYAVWRRLAGGVRGSFPLEGSNWFRRPEDTSATAWRADIALLEQMHRSLRGAVETLPANALDRAPMPGNPSSGGVRTGASPGGETAFSLISGVAAHDVYHAGQIQLLKRLSGESGEMPG